jgi:hypothetical protein
VRAPATLALLAAACADPWQAERLDRVCEDVGYSVSAVAFTCTNDEVVAQRAFDRFHDRYRCRIEEIHGDLGREGDVEPAVADADGVPLEVYYTCPAEVGAVPCRDYRGYAADDFAGMDDWLGVAPACATILARADGSRLPVVEP